MQQKSEEHTWAIEAITLFYKTVGEIATANLKSDRKLQLLTLILSTATSGALWVLIATKFENVGAWVGAIAATVITFLTIYQSSFGPNKTNIEAQLLYEEIGEYLAKLASSKTFDDLEFRNEARKFEAKLRKIDYKHPILNYRPMLGGNRYDSYDYLQQLKHIKKDSEDYF